jgi:tetratricopeptide (TPR) repeat protein
MEQKIRRYFPFFIAIFGAGNLFYDIFYFWKFKKGEVWDRYFYVLNKCAKKYGILFVSKMLNEDRYEMMNKKRYFLTDVIIENDPRSIDYNYWDSNLDNYILSLRYVNGSYSSLYGQYLLRNFFHFEDTNILNNLKKIDKTFPQVYSDLSFYYYKKGNLNTAEDYLVYSYLLDQTSESVALNYANILIKSGKYQKAGAVINKCIKLNGESFKALYSKGVLYLDKAKNAKKRYGTLDEVDIRISRENFLKAVKYNNMDYKNFTNLGQTCAILGNYEEAKRFLGISLNINPNNEIAVKSLRAIDKMINKN